MILDTEFDGLHRMQIFQYDAHPKHYNEPADENDSPRAKKLKTQLQFHRATSGDISFNFEYGFRNAWQFANLVLPFQVLTDIQKQLVVSEYGIAFTLVDQALASAQMNEGLWFLQNRSVLSSNYYYGLPFKYMKRPNIKHQAILHLDFIEKLVRELQIPFAKLKIDEMDCVFLKVLLLMTPSFPGKVKILDFNNTVSRCMAYLMSYSMQRFPEDGMTRYGEMIILMGNIRSAVKAFYNHTRVSELFHVSKFEPGVKNRLLS